MKYFLYCRKSTDEAGKQILSLESQQTEMNRRVALWAGVEIVEVLEEAKSAKQPGRSVFNAMLKRIKNGEADGIVAWDPDRLARNSVDGGKIIHMLDTGAIKDLKFATYTFEDTPQGKFMLSIMFGNSKYYVDTLSVSVKRGMVTKAEHGWSPTLAPLGYLNEGRGKFTVRDPERFDLVCRMWRLMLTGAYSVAEICRIANDEWGLRTVKRIKVGGGKLSLSSVYRIFSNPFYAGVFVWARRTWPGEHEAMITLAEFERVQVLLGRASRPRSQTHDFPLVGLIRCGECGYAVTAEEKLKPSGKRYTYYRCTKKRPGYTCIQKPVSAQTLDVQVVAFLTRLEISSASTEWALERIEDGELAKKVTIDASRTSLDRAFGANSRERSNLTTMRIRDLLNDEEFNERRELLDRDKLRIEEERRALDVSHSWLEPAKKLKMFCERAVEWYRQGDARIKRLILYTVGSNPTLKDKILFVQAKEPLREQVWPARISEWCSPVNEVRTLVATNDPDFKQMIANIDELIALTRPPYERKLSA